jgi:hypothetical protein
MEKVYRPRASGVARREVFAGVAGLAAAGALGACNTQTEAGYRPSGLVSRQRIARVFDDPVLEAGRLLKEAAEIEHDLMVQYLYAAFSLKPSFAELAGYGAPESTSVLGVAIQEMQHLRAVNSLLSELGYAPVLSRHDFPEEVGIYPFQFRLEPMSRESLAKYVYCEAPPDALIARTLQDELFIRKLTAAIGDDPRPNHVGSLYNAVIDVVAEVGSSTDLLANPDQWLADLNAIKGEGEHDHYLFFRSLFESSNPLLSDPSARIDVWVLDKAHARYPALDLSSDPTAYPGNPRSIEDPAVRSLAWLGNLTYWLTLAVLDLGYRDRRIDTRPVVQGLMLGPLQSLARALPAYGVGLPFDPLSMGENLCPSRNCGLRAARRIAREAITLANAQAATLPSDFPLAAVEQALAQIETWSA